MSLRQSFHVFLKSIDPNEYDKEQLEAIKHELSGENNPLIISALKNRETISFDEATLNQLIELGIRYRNVPILLTVTHYNLKHNHNLADTIEYWRLACELIKEKQCLSIKSNRLNAYVRQHFLNMMGAYTNLSVSILKQFGNLLIDPRVEEVHRQRIADIIARYYNLQTLSIDILKGMSAFSEKAKKALIGRIGVDAASRFGLWSHTPSHPESISTIDLVKKNV